MMGHSLGAAGAIEAVISILALQNQFLPPNINFRNGDAGLDLNIVANSSQPGSLRTVLSNSFGFGGTNASVDHSGDRGMSLGIAGMGWVTPLGSEPGRRLGAFAEWRDGGGRINFESARDAPTRCSPCRPRRPRRRRRIRACGDPARFRDSRSSPDWLRWKTRNSTLDADTAARTALDLRGFQRRGHLHQAVLSRDRGIGRSGRQSRCSFPKRFSTRQPAIWRPFSESPARVTPWSAMARSEFWR